MSLGILPEVEETKKNPHAVALGKLARGKTSTKKANSSRVNGALGGRPKGSKKGTKVNGIKKIQIAPSDDAGNEVANERLQSPNSLGVPRSSEGQIESLQKATPRKSVRK